MGFGYSGESSLWSGVGVYVAVGMVGVPVEAVADDWYWAMWVYDWYERYSFAGWQVMFIPQLPIMHYYICFFI